MPTNLSNKKNSNIARSHNLRFMARAMVAYLIVAQLVTKRQIISSSLFFSQMQLFKFSSH